MLNTLRNLFRRTTTMAATVTTVESAPNDATRRHDDEGEDALGRREERVLHEDLDRGAADDDARGQARHQCFAPRIRRNDGSARIDNFDRFMTDRFERDEDGEEWSPRTDRATVADALSQAAMDLEAQAQRAGRFLRDEAQRLLDDQGPVDCRELRSGFAYHVQALDRDTTSLLAYLWYAELQERRAVADDTQAAIAAIVTDIATTAVSFHGWFLEYDVLDGDGNLQNLMSQIDDLHRRTGRLRPSEWLAAADRDCETEALEEAERSLASLSGVLRRARERTAEAAATAQRRREQDAAYWAEARAEGWRED